MIASVDTYLRFAEATNRLDLIEQGGGKPLDEFIGNMQESGAGRKVKGAVSGAKKALTAAATTMTTRSAATSRQEVVVATQVHCMSRMAATDPCRPDVAGGPGLFVYGVVEATARLPDGLSGLDEAPLRKVVHGRCWPRLSRRSRSSVRPGDGLTCLATAGLSTRWPSG